MHLITFSTGNFTRLINKRVLEPSKVRLKHFVFDMGSKPISTYEKAVCALNGLQSNAETIKKSAAERSAKAHLNILNTAKHLRALGIKSEDVDALNVIHVAGTKGKGSTCAFTETILRKHGYKTGFYCSPHIISVNERICINGSPLSKELFAKYFWNVYNSIHANLKEDETMPPYFLFLTVMAFYVFVKEQIEAAVIEVGLGGLFDCTNFVKKPVAVGITTLGIDHVSVLGHTITEIASQKAGIMKPSVPCYTVSQQENAVQVLCQKAQETGCSLFLSPPLEAYEQKVALGVLGIVQNVNASLALQLTNTWLKHPRKKGKDFADTSLCGSENSQQNGNCNYLLPMAPTFPIDSATQSALEECKWPGRFQILPKGKLTYFLDGAHTRQSIQHCVRWFQDASSQYKSNSRVLRILLFNCTGERNPETLLGPLSDIQFDIALFCPNKIHQLKDVTSDLSDFMVDPVKEIQQSIVNREIWGHLMRSLYENEIAMSSNSFGPSSEIPMSTSLEDSGHQFSTCSEAVDFITATDLNNDCSKSAITEVIKGAENIHVLVTGSLRLVGAVLSLIACDLK